MKRVPLFALLALLSASFGLIGCGADVEASEEQEQEIADLASRGVGGDAEAQAQQEGDGN
jgi:hypothetical protein